MGGKETEEKELTREQKLNKMRKEFRVVENIWLFSCSISLLGTFVYLFFVYKMPILANTPLRYIFMVLLLLLIAFCIYLLPVLLKKNKKYKTYSMAYKNAYVKPLLEETFGEGSYSQQEKISIKDITEFSMLRQAKSALANDCVSGVYENIPFLRYDLTLRYGKKNGASDCVLIATDIKTHLKDELQIIHEQFNIGGEEYEQPEGYCKVLSGKDGFDKKFSIYTKDQKEGEKFAKDLPVKKIESLAKKTPLAIFFDRKKVYLVLKRDKDVMEAPIYRAVKEERCLKEAGEEVVLIKLWIEIVKECV